MSGILAIVAQMLITAVIGLPVVAAVRWMTRQSAVVGYLVTAGILLRAILGLSLFWISYLNLPVLRSLQMGNGFWSVMPDASGYYRSAVGVVEHGLGSLSPGSASPFFVKTLAVWMQIVGVSPAAALFLNLCLFVVLLAGLVRVYRPVNDWRRDLPLIVAVSAFSFSPMMLINSTQALKDDLFMAIVAAACIGARFVLRPLVSEKRSSVTRLDFLGGLVLLVGSIYGIAGIRDYFAVIVWAAMMVALACSARGPWRVAPRYAGRSLLILSTVWLAYAWGSGPYYRGPTVGHVASLVTGQPRTHRAEVGLELSSASDVAEVIEQARSGFASTGGATNIAASEDHVTSCWACLDGVRRRAKVLSVGLAALFVPISALKALSIVDFPGGGGLLAVADVDAIFTDLTIVGALTLFIKRRRAVGDRLAFALFAATLSGTTALLLAYVVTNVGTLLRMRLMIAVPVWILMLALSDRHGARPDERHLQRQALDG